MKLHEGTTLETDPGIGESLKKKARKSIVCCTTPVETTIYLTDLCIHQEMFTIFFIILMTIDVCFRIHDVMSMEFPRCFGNVFSLSSWCPQNLGKLREADEALNLWETNTMNKKPLEAHNKQRGVRFYHPSCFKKKIFFLFFSDLIRGPCWFLL